MVVESGSRTEAAAPGSPQQGKAGEIERTATQQGEPPPSIAVGVDDDVCRQEPSPLSPPEGLEELRASERDKEWCRPGEKIEAEGASRNDASPHCPGGAAPDTEDTGKATPLATAAVHREEKKPPKEEAESTEGLPRDQMSAVALNGRGGPSGGGVEASTAALELQTKARDQAKRLALEVARLRSSLRATTSELNTERSTRVRVEVRTIYRANCDRLSAPGRVAPARVAFDIAFVPRENVDLQVIGRRINSRQKCGRFCPSHEFEIRVVLICRTSGGRKWENGRRNVGVSSRLCRKPNDAQD